MFLANLQFQTSILRFVAKLAMWKTNVPLLKYFYKVTNTLNSFDFFENLLLYLILCVQYNQFDDNEKYVVGLAFTMLFN